MLIISTIIGIYFGCFGTRQRTKNEYLLGNKNMSIFPIAMSLTASHISGITLLGAPSEIYTFGTQYWMMCLAACIVCAVVATAYLPVFYTLQLTSTYEVCRCLIRGGADKLLVRPTTRCRRTESIIRLKEGSVHVPNCKSFLVTEAERKYVRRRARFQQHRDASCQVFFFL